MKISLTGLKDKTITNGTVSGCTFTGTVNVNQYQAGGIVGYNAGSGTVIGCYNSGSITSTNDYAGGIVGYIGYEDSVTS